MDRAQEHEAEDHREDHANGDPEERARMRFGPLRASLAHQSVRPADEFQVDWSVRPLHPTIVTHRRPHG